MIRRCLWAALAIAAGGARRPNTLWPRPRDDPPAARRVVADLLRRLHRAPLQHADADQPVDAAEPRPGLGIARFRAGIGTDRTRRRRRRRAGVRRPRRRGRRDAADRGRRGHRRVQRRRTGANPRLDPDGRRDPLRHVTRQRVGGRREGRHDPLAVLLEDTRRHAHRPSRRGHVARVPLHGDPRRLPGEDRREDRQGDLACRHLAVRAAGTSRRWPRSSSATI